MNLTRANVENILIRRAGKLMIAADLDGTTFAGANADLNDPIGYALRQAGYSVADVTSVADADLVSVGADDYDKLFDLAEYRLMENLEGNFDDVNISASGRSESLNQLVQQVQTKLNRITTKIQKLYGIGQGTLTGGVIGLDFMQKDDEPFINITGT